jgi:hypothetical protein
VGRNNAKELKLWLLVFSSALKVNANYTFKVEEPLSRLIPKQEIL